MRAARIAAKAVCLLLLLRGGPCHALDAGTLVEEAWSYYRGDASTSRVKMTIRRPDWQREMVIQAWTRGTEESLFFVESPPKDSGNGTLKRGDEMWIYNPKVNRVIKLPPSMMSQAWMGSDFSNNDLVKSDDIFKDYVHTIEGTEVQDGMKVYRIRSVPKPAAPVVWGMQELQIREDHVLLSEGFYDEEGKLVKRLTGSQIQMLGGKLFPRTWKMQKAGEKEGYTLLEYLELRFEAALPDSLFSLSSLRHPPR